MIDIGKVPVSVRSVSKNLDKIRTDRSNTEKEKKRIARKKERRATLILGKVQGSHQIYKIFGKHFHIFPFLLMKNKNQCIFHINHLKTLIRPLNTIKH